MSDDGTTVLLNDVMCCDEKHSLYYYAGNFFYPPLTVTFERGRVRRAIREFCKVNSGRIKRDRDDPNYKTILQLFDEQYPEG